MNLEDQPPHNTCNECGETFDSSFDLVDHLLEDDEEFDPYLVLPSGYRLMLGSMLKFIYNNADNPEQVKLITQSTFVTLFASENGYEPIEELIEEMVVKSALKDFDDSLKTLLEEENPTNESGE
jgi:hypothetical protein